MMDKTVNLSAILEVWESFTGWYWFITEHHEEHLAFGLVRGHETEWGYVDRGELYALEMSHQAWRVPKRNWALCPCVINDADSSSPERRYHNGNPKKE